MADSIVPQIPVEDNDQDPNEFLSLWEIWWNAFLLLRPAFVQMQSFLSFTVIVAGLTISTESFGVTSIVRALKLHPRCLRMPDQILP